MAATMEGAMRLGVIRTGGEGVADAALVRLAEALAAEGRQVIGAVQSRPGGSCADEMALRLLPEGRQICISQDLGPAAEGCRLDAHALEQAVAGIEAAFAEGGADLVIVNRFGKLEAEGRGFAGLIARALEVGVPVICGLAPKLEPAFAAYAGDLAQDLPADATALGDWWARAMATAA
ncbi:DUF2478 domain-containing protein [Frigidibacter sp. MR17.14]|uniref:DUF2478 domain-containing protein n=1 Tax=Frigidibacter sp. MR17.14 TaxID=3126509 RepID=UPI003012AB73